MLAAVRAEWKLRRLIRDWVTFRDRVLRYQGASDVTPEVDARFLKLKARIARELPLITVQAPRALAQEAHNHQGFVVDLLNRYQTLRADVSLDGRERELFEKGWHQNFIFLNELRGAGLAAGRRAGASAARGVPTGFPRRRRRSWPGVGLARFAVRLGVAVLILYIVAWGVGIQRGLDGRLTARLPASFAEAGQNLWSGVLSIYGGFQSFMRPVITTYGLEATIAMVGILLLGIGYLVFVRK